MLFLNRRLPVLLFLAIHSHHVCPHDDDLERIVTEDKLGDNELKPTLQVEIGKVPTPNEVPLDEDVDATPHLPDESSIVVDRRNEIEDDNDSTKNSDSYPKFDETLITPEKNFYTFDVIDINGETVNLEKYRGKVSLVVNVASECGFTDSHYTALVRMQSVLGSTGKFTVLAFPCNQFGAQEPGEDSQIKNFAVRKYSVNFRMFSKIKVLDSGTSEAWKYLEEKSGKVPNWNFWKYLVDEEGVVLDAWGPWTAVDDIFDTVKSAVDKLSKPQDPVLPNIISHDAGEL